MSTAEILEQIRRLPETERMELVGRIEDEFGEAYDDLTPAQIAEFERRGERLQRDPASGTPWEQVRAELKDRIKARSCPGK